MASSLAQQRALVRRMYGPLVFQILAVTLVLSLPYLVLLGRLLDGTMRGAGFGPVRRVRTGVLFMLPLLLCALGHDTTRWIGAMCIDATLFLLYLNLAAARDSPVRRFLAEWASGPAYVPWLVYLVAIGPYGATGLRSAEQLVGTWFGR